ncbi:hypothetical protein ACHAWF_004385 [Thalassiosira exigua]
MILYSVIARAKDGAVLVESAVAGLEGNFPQITIELLRRVVSSSNWESALGTLQSSSQVELLPDGGKRTFVQRHSESSLSGFFSGVATQWSCFGLGNVADEESGDANKGELDYYFHLSRKDNVICLCISDDVDARYHAVNFDFLDDVDAKFAKAYAPYKVTKAKAYEMDKKFKQDLGKLMYFYNENRNKMVRQDKVNNLLGKVDDLKGVLGKNIMVTLEREGKLAGLIEQSDEMLEDTKVFTKRSSRLRTKVKREYYSYYVIAFVFGLLVLYLFLGELCGYTFQKCLANNEEGG